MHLIDVGPGTDFAGPFSFCIFLTKYVDPKGSNRSLVQPSGYLMFSWLYDLGTNCAVLLAQLEAKPVKEEGADAANNGGGGGLFNSWTMFIMLGVMGLWFFLLILRPQQKDSAKSKEMLEKLKKNDRVVTAGGIIGTVVNIKSESDSIKIRIDDSNNTTMNILRQSIIRVLGDEGDDNKK